MGSTWSFRQAQLSLHKTERDHIRETVLYGVVPGALLGGVQSIIFKYTYNKIASANPSELQNQASVVFSIAFCCMMMATLASYILWKTHLLNLSMAVKSMQKNVAAVALVFCICLIPMLIISGEVAFQSAGKVITFLDTTISLEIAWFFIAANHGVNIFIYTALSQKFRTTLFDLLSVNKGTSTSTSTSTSLGF
jgi:cytochrome bd-type quinol oxidase subunit 2